MEDHGIPAHEIRFIQEAKSEKPRKEIIRDSNEGNIRVLFGSTEMLGTGVNAQKRAVAVHHLDIPWRPSDLAQRDGRAIRKGNEIAKCFAGNKVAIFIYAVEKSLDSYKFNTLYNKQVFIDQLKTNSLGKRTIDEGAFGNSFRIFKIGEKEQLLMAIVLCRLYFDFFNCPTFSELGSTSILIFINNFSYFVV